MFRRLSSVAVDDDAAPGLPLTGIMLLDDAMVVSVSGLDLVVILAEMDGAPSVTLSSVVIVAAVDNYLSSDWWMDSTRTDGGLANPQDDVNGVLSAV